jgi:F-type H+-transporting ATPase subunit b
MNLTMSLFAQLVVFGILAWFTAKFIWPPLKNALDERAAKVAAAMEAADRGKAALGAAGGRAQEQLAVAREQGQKLLADYDRRTHTIIEEARRVADAEAARIVASARMEADQLLDRARVELREQLASIAVAGAEQILRKEIDAAAHAKLVAQLKTEL